MINKKFLKEYINDQEVLPKIDLVLSISEQRSRNILATNSWYKDLYINPDVDIINSHPQVTQQVREELVDFLQLLSDKDFETVIQGDSTIVHSEIDGGFDALFIDGNHSYEYVKKDLENYWDKVRDGGIIALHDVNFEGERYGSPRVLRESGYNWKFISYSKEVGIAYLIKGEE